RWSEVSERYAERRPVTRAARRGSCAGASRRRDHHEEVLVHEEDSAAAQLREEDVRLEEPFVDPPAGTVVEDAVFPARCRQLGPPQRADDHELGGDSPRLREEANALGLLQVAVEVAREKAIERAVVERKLESVTLDECGVRRLLGGDREHLVTLVEPDDLATEVPGHEACSTRDVERPRGRQLGDRCLERTARLVPTGAHPRFVETAAQPPSVVLPGACVVVGLHPRLLEYGRCCRSSRCRTSRRGASVARSTPSARR